MFTMTISDTAPQSTPKSHRWVNILLVVLLVIGPLLAVGGVFIQRRSADEQARIAFSAANNLYATGQYELAQQAYQQMLNQGVESTELLYNLALTQIQRSDGIGAVQTLQQAQQSAPRDARISDLLTRAETLASTQGATIPPVEAPVIPLRSTEGAVLAILLWAAAGACVAGAILIKRMWARVTLTVCALLLALCAIGVIVLI